MAFSIHLSFALSISLPLCYSLKIINYRISGKKIFVYMATSVSHVMSKVAENHIFILYRIFRHVWLTTVADWDSMDPVVT